LPFDEGAPGRVWLAVSQPLQIRFRGDPRMMRYIPGFVAAIIAFVVL